MNCEDRKPLWMELAAGGLPDDEAEPLRHHLASCETCQLEFAEATRALAGWSLTLDPVPPSAAAWERLAQRLTTAERPADVLLSPEPETNVIRSEHRSRYLRTAIWSAVAGATATSLLVHLLIGRPLRLQVISLQEQQMSQQEQIHALSEHLHFASHSLSELRSPYLNRVDFEGTDATMPGSGYAIFDGFRRQLHCYFFDLAAESPGAYAVWLEQSDGAKTLGGVAQRVQGEDFSLLITLEGPESLNALLLTREPTAAPASIEGPLVMRALLPSPERQGASSGPSP